VKAAEAKLSARMDKMILDANRELAALNSRIPK
jgi:hypothetical protein